MAELKDELELSAKLKILYREMKMFINHECKKDVVYYYYYYYH